MEVGPTWAPARFPDGCLKFWALPVLLGTVLELCPAAWWEQETEAGGGQEGRTISCTNLMVLRKSFSKT